MNVTDKVLEAKNFAELKKVIEENAPFQGSRREYSAKEIINAANYVKAGGLINAVTRGNGLRAKVAELILANNYGEAW